MGAQPQKRTGFQQGVFQTSKNKKERLGTLRVTRDGRKWRYAKAGSSALVAGKMGIAPVINSDHMNQTCPETAKGARQLTLTVTAGTAIAEDALEGGYFHINDDAGKGHQYPIQGNTAISGSGTSISITLEEPIQVALTTSSEFTLVASPWLGVTESTTEESLPVGIAPVAVTGTYYYWALTGGPAIALVAGSPAVGTMLTLSGTAGALAAINATLDIDQPIIAISHGTAGVSGEYKPIFLKID